MSETNEIFVTESNKFFEQKFRDSKMITFKYVLYPPVVPTTMPDWVKVNTKKYKLYYCMYFAKENERAIF